MYDKEPRLLYNFGSFVEKNTRILKKSVVSCNELHKLSGEQAITVQMYQYTTLIAMNDLMWYEKYLRTQDPLSSLKFRQHLILKYTITFKAAG